MEGANLHRAAARQQGRVERLEPLAQRLRALAVVQAGNAALAQGLQQPLRIGLRELAQPVVQALSHFAGSLASEGDGQDLMGLAGVLRILSQQGPQHARDQYPGLACAGAGLDGHAAPGIAGHGVELLGRHRLAVDF